MQELESKHSFTKGKRKRDKQLGEEEWRCEVEPEVVQ